ncbi:hypothetical protein G6F68_019010 [Rhizopus microsporus]|nr:hypothetical protein G6F68_019010 [Rhizopus microsporus]
MPPASMKPSARPSPASGTAMPRTTASTAWCWLPACTGARHLCPLPAAGPPAGGTVRSPLRSGHRPREQGRHRRRPGAAEGPPRCAGRRRRRHPEGAQDRGRRPQG